MLRTVRGVFSIALWLLFSGVAFAQYGSSLQGTVTDQSGAAVANAKVTATDQGTHVSHDTTTNGSVFYALAGRVLELQARFSF